MTLGSRQTLQEPVGQFRTLHRFRLGSLPHRQDFHPRQLPHRLRPHQQFRRRLHHPAQSARRRVRRHQYRFRPGRRTPVQPARAESARPRSPAHCSSPRHSPPPPTPWSIPTSRRRAPTSGRSTFSAKWRRNTIVDIAYIGRRGTSPARRLQRQPDADLHQRLPRRLQHRQGRRRIRADQQPAEGRHAPQRRRVRLPDAAPPQRLHPHPEFGGRPGLFHRHAPAERRLRDPALRRPALRLHPVPAVHQPQRARLQRFLHLPRAGSAVDPPPLPTASPSTSPTPGRRRWTRVRSIPRSPWSAPATRPPPPTLRSTSTTAASITPTAISTAATSSSGTVVAELPFGKGKHFLHSASGLVDRVLGGWEVTGYGRVTSGRPFSAFSGSNTVSNVNQSTANCTGCSRGDGIAVHSRPPPACSGSSTPPSAPNSPPPAPASSATPAATSSSDRTSSKSIRRC